MNSFKAASVLSLFTTLAAAWPASPAWNSTSSSTGYACNPAHSYPGGASCISTAGSLTLVTPTAWTTSTTVYTTDYVTYCPTPTVVTINKQTITVTKATTLTVPCPTTAVVTKPVLVGPTAGSAAPSMPAASKPAGSMPAASMPAASMPAASMPGASMPAVVCPPAQTVTVTQYVTVSMESPKAPVSAPATTQKPSSAPSASACATALFDGCNPARSSCPNGPGTFTTVTPSTYPTSYVINGQTVSFTAAPTSCLPSSSAAMSSKAASSAPASKPASSAPASSAPASKASSAVPAPSASAAGKCPLDLKAGAYEYPHALRVNGVNGYNIVVGKDSKTDVVFDIPQADAGKTCNTYFALPAKSGLVTSDYTLSGAGVITVSKGGKVVNTFTPQPNNAYLIESGKCASGQAVTYTFSTSDALTLSLFNDFNACALGAFVTVA
ncbi:hypothetical protein E4T47_06382 [Aureobasidium subglaciale]|nr:hypothetical protein E4T47_06382 [Aureobasidium subglaciale]